MTGASTTRGRRGVSWRRVLFVLAGLAAAAVTAVVLINSSDELVAAADVLTSLNVAWVGVAVVAEVVSYGLRGAAQTAVLRRGAAGAGPPAGDGGGGAAPGVLVLGAAQWAGDAAAYCLPFGFAASGVVMVRALHRRGVVPVLATWMFAVCTVFYVGSVAVLTVVAIQIAGDQDPVSGLAPVTYGLVTTLVLVVLVWRSGAHRPVARALGRRRRGRPGADAGDPGPARWRGRVARWWRDQVRVLRAVRLPGRVVAGVFGLMTLSWLADFSVLGISYAALGSAPPWSGLLLAYCASQVAAAVPVTPGGIGVVEGSLTLALVAFGGAQNLTLAAVLLYRLITYWGCIPMGGLAWLALRLAPDRRPLATAGSRLVEDAA